jgi:hypothetical protein
MILGVFMACNFVNFSMYNFRYIPINIHKHCLKVMFSRHACSSYLVEFLNTEFVETNLSQYKIVHA